MTTPTERMLHQEAVSRADAAALAEEPFVVYGAHLFLDSVERLWCAMLKNDIAEEPVHAFGKSPAEAVSAFNKAWCEKLPGGDAAQDGDTQ